MKHTRKKHQATRLKFRLFDVVLWIFVCEAIGIIGAMFTTPSIPTWYAALIKPSFAPPNWIFAPVWTTLYALMGIAAYRIWQLGWNKHGVRKALIIFGIQLFLNAIWSPIFFGARNIPLAFVTIGALWISIIVLIFRFHKLDRVSAALFVPYLFWVSFALVLNFQLWILNG